MTLLKFIQPSWVFILLFSLCSPMLAVADSWLYKKDIAMGTEVSVELWRPTDMPLTEAEQLMHKALAWMHRVDEGMSPYKNASELARLNSIAAKAPMQVSVALYDLIKKSLYYSELTGGAFDISFASVGFLYDYRTQQKPNDNQLQAQLPAVNYRLISLQDDRHIGFLDARVKLDLGGIAKGYAVDQAIAVLRDAGVRYARVAAGGDSRILGDRRGRPWMLGVRHPRLAEEMVAVLPIDNAAVSTSGDYERYFDQQGLRYHHIINPRTGDSARELTSVTVIGRQAVDTDSLSTSVFVLGKKQGLVLIEQIPDTEAILVDAEGQLYFSSGLGQPLSD